MTAIRVRKTHAERQRKKTAGEFYTPAWLARHIAETLLAFSHTRNGINVLEPSCGDGVFLRQASRVLQEAAPNTERSDQLVGVDVDPNACAAATASLQQAGVHARIRRADFLRDDLSDMSPTDGFDVIIGNPPFVNIRTLARTRPASAPCWRSAMAATGGWHCQAKPYASG